MISKGEIVEVGGYKWHSPGFFTEPGKGKLDNEYVAFLKEAISVIGGNNIRLLAALDGVMNSKLLQREILELTKEKVDSLATKWTETIRSECKDMSRVDLWRCRMQFLHHLAYAYEYSYREANNMSIYGRMTTWVDCPEFLPQHYSLIDPSLRIPYTICWKVMYCAVVLLGTVLVPGGIFTLIDIFSEHKEGFWKWYLGIELASILVIVITLFIKQVFSWCLQKKWIPPADNSGMESGVLEIGSTKENR